MIGRRFSSYHQLNLMLGLLICQMLCCKVVHVNGEECSRKRRSKEDGKDRQFLNGGSDGV